MNFKIKDIIKDPRCHIIATAEISDSSFDKNHRFIFYIAKDLSTRIALEKYDTVFKFWIKIQTRLFNFKKTLKLYSETKSKSKRGYSIDETKDGIYFVGRTDHYDIKDSRPSFHSEGYLLNNLEYSLLQRNAKKIKKRLKENRKGIINAL